MSTITLEHFKASFGWSPVPQDTYAGEHDRAILLTLARHVQARRVVEVGVQEGRTAATLLSGCPSIERYLGIDLPPGSVTALKGQQTELPVVAGRLARDFKAFMLCLIAGGTKELVEFPDSDFFFIDGEHTYEAVLHESEMALAACKRGVICWHDYDNNSVPGVRDAIDKLNQTVTQNNIVNVLGTWMCFLMVNP